MARPCCLHPIIRHVLHATIACFVKHFHTISKDTSCEVTYSILMVYILSILELLILSDIAPWVIPCAKNVITLLKCVALRVFFWIIQEQTLGKLSVGLHRTWQPGDWVQLKLPVPHPVHDIDRTCAVSGLGSAHKGEGGAMLQVNLI